MSAPLRSTLIPVTDPHAGLRLTELFYSLQGEAASSGAPTVFIRLTGCPLRCTYCDTTYSFEGGQRWSLEDILSETARHPVAHVCVTGGEPLAQPNCLPLLERLCDAGYQVSLETSGALDVSAVDPRVSIVLDLKTPASGEVHRNLWSNLAHLCAKDQVKCVITDRADYEWSREQLLSRQISEQVGVVWFSPAFSIVPGQTRLPALATELAGLILADGLPVRLQLQLHKLLWQDAQGK